MTGKELIEFIKEHKLEEYTIYAFDVDSYLSHLDKEDIYFDKVSKQVEFFGNSY